jgi:hypothetical protein
MYICFQRFYFNTLGCVVVDLMMRDASAILLSIKLIKSSYIILVLLEGETKRYNVCNTFVLIGKYIKSCILS